MAQVVKEKENIFSAYKLFAQTREERDPVWLVNLREKAGEAFESRDFPTTRIEEGENTNVPPLFKIPYRELLDQDETGLTSEEIAPFTYSESRDSQLVFVNGFFAREFSNLTALPNGCVVSNLDEIPHEHGVVARDHLAAYADYRDATFTALNTASIGDGAFVYIPEGQVVETPIHLLFVSTAQ